MAGSKTKRPERFSVFHIPNEVLNGLYIPAQLNKHVQLHTDKASTDVKFSSQSSHYSTPATTTDSQLSRVFASARQAQATCYTCGGVEFSSAEKQRAHHRTELHAVNMSRKVEWRKANPGATVAADEYPWQPIEALSDESDSDEGSVWGDSDASAVEDDGSEVGSVNTGPARGVKVTMDAETLAQELDTQVSKERAQDDADSSDEDVDADATSGRSGDNKLAQWLWFASDSQTAEKSSGLTTVYGIHRRVLVQRGQHGVHTSGSQIMRDLIKMQHPPMPSQAHTHSKGAVQTHMSEQSSVWVILALAGGFFAGAVFDNRSGRLLAHKTIQRYTTRRKQGGSQAKQDNAMGRAAQSAGAQIRRYNEQKLHEEISALMTQWHEYLRQSALVFVRVPTRESKVFFGSSSRPQAAQAMLSNDPRIRAVPVAIARPSLAELQRVYGELSTVRVRTVAPTVLNPGLESVGDSANEEAVSSAQSDAPIPEVGENVSGDDESEHTLDAEPRPDLLAFLHHVAKMILSSDMTDSQIIAYLEENMRQLLDALSDPAVGLRYLQDTDTIHAHRTPTLLHLASFMGRSDLIPYLIDHGEDPTVTNGYAPLYTGGLTAYEVAADQQTRDSLFAYRVENADDRDNPIDWERSRIPDPAAVKEKEDRAREKKRRERERRKAREKAKKEQKSRDEQQAQSEAADDQALDQAVQENEKLQRGKTAEWKRGIDSMTQAELKMRMLSMAHASADAWKVPRTVGSSMASSSSSKLPERPLSPGAQRARDRELRFQAFERRRQNAAAPAPKPAGPAASSGTCTHCGRELRGLVPFEQFDWKCCSIKCLQDHQRNSSL